MTLPFRRRHHDAEDTHDRARALGSRRFIEPIEADEEAWLARHLEACTECGREHDAFAADRELLRSLRDKPIEAPRDLWAKTAAALDVAAGRQPAPAGSERTSRPRGGAGQPWSRGLPVGTVAGVAVLLVVVGSALLPGVVPSLTQPSNPTAAGSAGPGPTAIAVAAAPIPALRSGANGSLDLFFTEVNKVCPRSSPECVPPPSEREGSTVNLLGAKTSTVAISPRNDQLVYEAEIGAAGEGKIYVVPVKPSATESQAPGTPPVSPSSGGPSPGQPSESPSTAGPTPIATPTGPVEIASGVTVVGEVAYSPDGQWLAFAAAPRDGSTGPDLYLYSAGSGTAAAVTSDHQTYFSAWLGGKVLASRVIPQSGPSAPGRAGESGAPGASGEGDAGNGPPIEAHASSFILDPAKNERTELAQTDVWMPVVDPSDRFVAFWSGTLRSTDAGRTWDLDKGALVLDGWNNEGMAAPDASAGGEPSSSAAPAIGPAGHASPVVTSHVEEFRAEFDPDGVRLAVWVGEHRGDEIGRLHLAVIDPSTGAIKPDSPLAGVPALRRFSIDANRLAWVSPSGQNGQESSLQVLGWQGDTFGQIQSEPAPDLLILR